MANIVNIKAFCPRCGAIASLTLGTDDYYTWDEVGPVIRNELERRGWSITWYTDTKRSFGMS